MTYSIFARDGTSRIVLKRESRAAADTKPRDLTALGGIELQSAEHPTLEHTQTPR